MLLLDGRATFPSRPEKSNLSGDGGAESTPLPPPEGVLFLFRVGVTGRFLAGGGAALDFSDLMKSVTKLLDRFLVVSFTCVQKWKW